MVMPERRIARILWVIDDFAARTGRPGGPLASNPQQATRLQEVTRAFEDTLRTMAGSYAAGDAPQPGGPTLYQHILGALTPRSATWNACCIQMLQRGHQPYVEHARSLVHRNRPCPSRVRASTIIDGAVSK